MGKLRIGIPKGSLQESTVRLFAKAGYVVSIAPRSYIPSFDDPELEGLLVRAQDMARYVGEGVLDVGLTGKDWIEESGAEVIEVSELVYAKATARPVRWVLAVPEGSDIRSVKDLEGRRVATELVKVTERYLREHGVNARVEFSWGATEAKVPYLVDAIVELTETGASLRAHGLRVVDTVIESTTRLIANPSSWRDPWKREKIENLSMLLVGALQAEGRVGLKMNVPKAKLDDVISKLPALHSPTISGQADESWVAVEVVIDERTVREIIPELKRAGAEGIIEYPLNKIIY